MDFQLLLSAGSELFRFLHQAIRSAPGSFQLLDQNLHCLSLHDQMIFTETFPGSLQELELHPRPTPIGAHMDHAFSDFLVSIFDCHVKVDEVVTQSLEREVSIPRSIVRLSVHTLRRWR